MNIEWDAGTYAKDFSYVSRYGSCVLNLVDFDRVTTAIDLGCGNGALTAEIAEHNVKVIGLDSSPSQIEAARASHPDIEFRLADATDFAVPEPVDLVFSNAVFHWIDRTQQPSMLACVAQALKPGGQFVFEFGGSGNNRLIHKALAEAFEEEGLGYHMPFFFPTIGEYAPLVEAAGFKVTHALLFERPTELRGEDGMRDWIDMFVKVPFEGIDPERAERIKQHAVNSLRPILFKDGRWYADYVRIRMKTLKQ
ncbi:MAG: class I SAM-dependent methyltransferase [Atopobiaceae bacterium]